MQKSPPRRGLLDDGAGARQALGRLPWFAPFFLRARRLRPVLPMVVLLSRSPGSQWLGNPPGGGQIGSSRALETFSPR